MSVNSKGHTLKAGQSLRLGESLYSPNGRYRLELQADGNLVLAHRFPHGGQHPTWATMTQQSAGHSDFVRQAVMQGDGNLVLYTHEHEHRNPRWSSQTNKSENEGAHLTLQNDGNLVMYKGDRAVWSSGTYSYAHWMEELDENLTLQDICVPGSHDAGMYYTKLAPGVGARGLALTQSESIYGQLRHGSRYFDLRPRHINGKGFYVFHGLADGPKMEVVLQDVRRFFEEGSQETVILEFSHWEDFAGQEHAFVDLLLRELPSQHLLKRLDFADAVREHYTTHKYRSFSDEELDQAVYNFDFATLPLKDLRGKIIVLINHHDMYRDVVRKHYKDGIHLIYNQLPIYDDYSNQQDYADMLRDQTDKFSKYDSQRGLFMLNWTLTPLGPDSYDAGNWAWVAGPAGWLINKATKELLPLAASTSVETYAGRINPKLRNDAAGNNALFKRNAKGRMVNIINLDYMHTADAVNVCRQLIKRNNPTLS